MAFEKQKIRVAKIINKTFAIISWASSGNINSSNGHKYDKFTNFWQASGVNHKIFTPDWITKSDIYVDIFEFDQGISSKKEHTKARLLSLLDQTAESAGALINYDYFQNIPHFTTSISHGQNAGAVIAVLKESCPGVGVDVESTKRTIPSKAKKFFTNKFDAIDEVENLLNLWTKKEAAFKALAPIDQEVKLLNHLWVKGNKFGKVGSLSQLGEVGTKTTNDQLIATAYLLKKAHL